MLHFYAILLRRAVCYSHVKIKQAMGSAWYTGPLLSPSGPGAGIKSEGNKVKSESSFLGKTFTRDGTFSPVRLANVFSAVCCPQLIPAHATLVIPICQPNTCSVYPQPPSGWGRGHHLLDTRPPHPYAHTLVMPAALSFKEHPHRTALFDSATAGVTTAPHRLEVEKAQTGPQRCSEEPLHHLPLHIWPFFTIIY